MSKVWEALFSLFDLFGILSSDLAFGWGMLTLSQFLMIFLYIMLSFCIILAVFRLVEHIAELFTGRWLR